MLLRVTGDAVDAAGDLGRPTSSCGAPSSHLPLQSTTRSVVYLLTPSTRSSGGVAESTGKEVDVDQRDTLPDAVGDV